MAQYVPLPDGSYVTVQEGETPAAAWQRAQKQYPEAFASLKPKEAPATGLGAALGKGVESMVGAGRTALGALFGEPEEAAKAGLERQKKLEEKYADQVSLEKVKKAYEEKGLLSAAGEALGQVPYAIAEQAPNIATTLGGAKAGAALGTMLGPVGTAAGAVIGGGLGAFAPSFLQQFGGNIERQAAEQQKAGQPVDISRLAAAGAAAPQAALDVAATFIPLGRTVAGKVLGPEVRALLEKGEKEAAEKLAKEGLGKTLMKGTAVGALAEIPTEITQQVLERAQAGLSLTDDDALREYGETAYQVGLLAPIGAAGRVAERGAARRQVATQEAEAQAAQRRAEAQAEEDRKKDPAYLMQVSQEYAALEAQKKALQNQIIKGTKEQPLDEAARQANKAINEQLAKLAPDLREKAIEFNKLGGKNAVAKLQEQQRVAALSPLEYQMEQMGVDLTPPAAPAERVFTGEEEVTPPVPEVQYAQQQMALAKQQDMGTFEAADFAQYLLQDPAMAQRLVDTKTAIPDVSKKDSSAILGMLKLQLDQQKKAVQAATAEQLQQQQADLAAAQKPVEADPLELWKSSVQQTEQQATDELLRPNFETLRPSGPPTVAVPVNITPIQNPGALLRRLDDLTTARDKAAAEAEDAFAGGNRELGAKKAQEREAAQLGLNQVEQLEGAPKAIVALRKAQDAVLMNVAQLVDDLRVGRTLGGQQDLQRSAFKTDEDYAAAVKQQQELRRTASSTPETLVNQINAQRDAYITATVQEAAINRKLFGKALTQEEATKAGDQIRDVFNEWVTRSMAAPRSAALEERVTQPAQMRGTELVKGAETELVDPRPLEERRFGAYRAATQVLQEQLRGITNKLVEVPRETQRVEPLLKMQFPTTEAAKVAEARGETAKTLEGALRRRRDYVSTLIDQVFQTRKVPGIAETLLTRAQDFMPRGTTAFLDAAENVADRLVRGQSIERSDLVTLRDELRAASARPGEAEVAGERVGQRELFPAEERRSLAPEIERGSIGVIRETPERFANAPIVKRSRAAAERARELLGQIKTAWQAADEAKQKTQRQSPTERATAAVEQQRSEYRDAFNAALEKAKVTELTNKFQPQIDAVINQLAMLGKERAKALRAKDPVAARDFETIINVEREELQTLRNQLDAALKSPSKAVEPAEMRGEKQLRGFTQPYEIAAAADDWVRFERDALTKAEAKLARLQGADKAPQVKAVAEQRAAVKTAEDITQRARTGLGLPGIRVERQAVAAEMAALAERIPKIKDPGKKRKAEERLARLEMTRREAPEEIKPSGEIADERAARAAEERKAEREAAEARRQEKETERSQLEDRALTLTSEIEDLRDARERARTPASKERIQGEIDERSKEVMLLQAQLETPDLTRTEKRKARKAQKTLYSSRGVTSEKELLTSIAQKLQDKQPLSAYEKRIWEGRAVKKSGVSAEGKKVLAAASEAQRKEREEAQRPAGTFGETLGVEDVLSSFDVGGKDIFFSRGATVNPSTTGTVRTELKKAFSDLGRVQIYDSVDALVKDNPQYEDKIPSDARGFVDSAGNKAFLIAENINEGQALSVLLHEVGSHIGLKNTLGEAQYNALVKAVDTWAKKDDGSVESRVAKAALDRVEAAKTKPSQRADETLAYAIEEAVNAGVKPMETKGPIGQWLGRIAQAFRKTLEKFGLPPKALDAQALVDMAFGAAKVEMTPSLTTEQAVKAVPEEGELLFSRAPAYAPGMEDAGRVADKVLATPKSFIERVKPNLIGLGFRTQFIDKLAPIEQVAKGMADSVKAYQMMYYLRMYDQRMNFTSQAVGYGAPQLVEKTRKDGQKERVLEATKGANIKDIVKLLSTKEVKEAAGSPDAANRLFTLYLAAKRADRVGLNALNFGGEITQADLDAAVKQVEDNTVLSKAFKDARDLYNEYNRDLIKFAVQTGAINESLGKRLVASDDYIPYYRVREGNAELMIGNETPIRIGNLKDSPHLQELVGGTEKIMNFLDSSVQNTSMLLDMSLRNIATKNAMFELNALGLVTTPKPAPKSGAPAGAITFKKEGVEYYVLPKEDKLKDVGIPADLLVKGLEGIPTMFPQFMRIMGMPSRFLRRAVVASPVYMARQLFRDSLSAYMMSGSDATPVLGALKQIGKESALTRRGVTGGQVFTGMPEDMSRLLREMQEGRPGWSKALSKLEAMSMEADAATRKAQYESYLKQGLSEMEATLMSLESMNFSRRGLSPSVHMATTLVPFMNAQIQSLDVMYRAFRGQMPFNDRLALRERMIITGLMLAAMSMAYASAMQDDDTYKNARPDEKYGNWFVKIPGVEQSVRVPIPFELGYIFKALPEAIVNTMTSKHGGEEAVEAFTRIAQQLIPGGTSYGIPQAIKPLIEVGLGKSFYTGRDIESAKEQAQMPGTRYRDNTSEAAKYVGSALNISPIKLEALINGYTGSMGLALLQSLNVMLPDTGPEKAAKRLSDMPVVGTLFQPEDSGGIIDATYKALQEATQVHASYKALIDKGEYGKAQALIQGKLDEMSLNAIAGKFKQQMGQFAKAEQAIRSSNLSPEEKRKSLDVIRQIRIGIASSVRAVVDKTKSPEVPA